MFEFIRGHQKLAQLLLAAVFLPFAFFGIDAARNTASVDAVAVVEGQEITLRQFEEALAAHKNNLRRSLGVNYDEKSADGMDNRRLVLENLITQQLLQQEAEHLNIPLEHVMRMVIGGIKDFQIDGAFSQEQYESKLAEQGRSVEEYEAEVRKYLRETQPPLISALASTSVIPVTSVQQMTKLLSEVRTVRAINIALDDFKAKVKVSAESAQKYYEQNKSSYIAPQQMRAEFLTLSMDKLKVKQPDDETIAKWYENNKNQYQSDEVRYASHILLSVEAAASDEKKAAVRARLEKILREARTADGDFAELAKQHSQDPGSAKSGGDLGIVDKGAMVKPFEDAVFALQLNEISDIVETEFGYHIIKLTGLTPAAVKPLESVKAKINAEIVAQAAARRFAEVADDFSNLVYEQSDSLQPAADKYELKIETSDWFSRDNLSSLSTPYRNHKLLKALFSAESIEDRHNTEVVEILPKVLVAARIVEYKPQAQIPFDDIKQKIMQRLERNAASDLAKQDGKEKLDKLLSGQDKLQWGEAKQASQLDSTFNPIAIRAIFQVSTDKLPAYNGALQPDGSFVIYKVEGTSSKKMNDQQRQQLANGVRRVLSSFTVGAYIQALRGRYEIEINHKLLAGNEAG